MSKNLSMKCMVGNESNKFSIKSIFKTVLLQLSTDGEASQVIGPPTQGQTRNQSVVNTLFLCFSCLQMVKPVR